MAAPFLIDTDVAIDYLRGTADAIAYIEGLSGNNFISAITVAELYAGVRDGAERTALNAFLLAFQVVEVNASIAEQGGLFAVISARAMESDSQMLSLLRAPKLRGQRWSRSTSNTFPCFQTPTSVSQAITPAHRSRSALDSSTSGLFQFNAEPRPRIRPPGIHRTGRDTQNFGALGERQAAKMP